MNRLVLGILTAAVFLAPANCGAARPRPCSTGVSIFGAIGYAISLFLGWRLMRAIRKSGNIQSKD